jgi:hypothetical protein
MASVAARNVKLILLKRINALLSTFKLMANKKVTLKNDPPDSGRLPYH